MCRRNARGICYVTYANKLRGPVERRTDRCLDARVGVTGGGRDQV